STASAGAVDAAGEMEVLLGGAGQDPNEHDPASVDRDDLGHRRVRLLVADENEHAGPEGHTRRNVQDIGMRQPGAIDAVVVNPEVGGGGHAGTASSGRDLMKIELQPDGGGVAAEHVEADVNGVVLDELDFLDRQAAALGDLLLAEADRLPLLPEGSRDPHDLREPIDRGPAPRSATLLLIEVGVEVIDFVLVDVVARLAHDLPPDARIPDPFKSDAAATRAVASPPGRSQRAASSATSSQRRTGQGGRTDGAPRPRTTPETCVPPDLSEPRRCRGECGGRSAALPQRQAPWPLALSNDRRARAPTGIPGRAAIRRPSRSTATGVAASAVRSVEG